MTTVMWRLKEVGRKTIMAMNEFRRKKNNNRETELLIANYAVSSE